MQAASRLARRMAVGAIALACSLGGHAAAQDLKFFRIGTGSTAGTYFPIGSLIGSAISNPPGSRPCHDGGACGVPGLIAVAQTSAGSVANLKAIVSGRYESGLAQSDIVHQALEGRGEFAKPMSNIRAIAYLYPESLHLVVAKRAGITSVPDLVGKRVSLDTAGSGTHVNAELIIAAYGLKAKQMKAVHVNPQQALNMMERDELDAFFFVGGAPASGISVLAQQGLIDLLPIDGEVAAKILQEHRFFSTDRIPDTAYPGIGWVDTLSVGALWVVAADLDEELVYQVTKALWHPNNRKLLDSGHIKARLIQEADALTGIRDILHPGAERYYREAGRLR